MARARCPRDLHPGLAVPAPRVIEEATVVAIDPVTALEEYAAASRTVFGHETREPRPGAGVGDLHPVVPSNVQVSGRSSNIRGRRRRAPSVRSRGPRQARRHRVAPGASSDPGCAVQSVPSHSSVSSNSSRSWKSRPARRPRPARGPDRRPRRREPQVRPHRAAPTRCRPSSTARSASPGPAPAPR